MAGARTQSRSRNPGTSVLVTLLAAAVLLPALALAAPSSARLQTPQFRVPATVSTGGTLPRDIVVADFNRDGRTDAAAGNIGPAVFHGGVSVMLGDGTGALGDAIQTSLGPDNGADDLAVADFNNDGTPDLAALQAMTGSYGPIAILLGNGDGTFDAAAGSPLANGAEGQIETGDLNRDGNADLVYSRRSGANIRVYFGDGSGGFAAPDQYSPSFGSWDIALADVNTDGQLDLVAASGGSPWTMLGEAGGRLGTQRYQYMPTLTGLALTLGDFDGNGKPDIAMVDASGGHVSTGLGVGDGSFTPRAQYGIAQQATWVTAGDFNGDGRLDLVANNVGSASGLLHGNGDGTFGAPTYFVTGAMGFTPAQLNGDGELDLVAFSDDPGIVYTTLGDAKETFRAPRNTPTTFTGALAQGDVNGDGQRDFVVGGETVSGGSIVSALVSHLGSGNGRFGPPIESAQRPDEVMEGILVLVLADVNEDGRLDAVAGLDFLYAQTENILVALGRGDGTFGAPAQLGTSDTHAHVSSLAVVDVTGDGHLDIVSHTNQQLAVLPGTGTGAFGAPIISGSSSFNQNATLVADFTGDGVLDVAAVFRTGNSDFGAGEIRLQRGNGNGTFALIQTVFADSNLGGGQVADFNSDGRLDVAVSGSAGTNGGRSGLYVTLNVAGALGQHVYYPVGCGSIDVADLNRDGTTDIVSECGIFTLSLNPGDGTFDRQATLPTGSSPFLTADYTRDGRPDLLGLVYANGAQFSLAVNSTPPFALPTHRRPSNPAPLFHR